MSIDENEIQLKLYLFGYPHIEKYEQPLHIPRKKILALLGYLAVHQRAFTRDSLASLFWPDSDDTHAHANLRTILCEMYYSILLHEMAHYFNSSISPDLFPILDEAIAGFVQYSLMDPNLRCELLKREESKSFSSYREIVMSAYINEPDGFLGSAYLYLRRHTPLMKRWLIHQQPMPKDPFFI